MSFRADTKITVEALNHFYEQSVAGEGPVIRQPPMSELIAKMEPVSYTHLRAHET